MGRPADRRRARRAARRPAGRRLCRAGHVHPSAFLVTPWTTPCCALPKTCCHAAARRSRSEEHTSELQSLMRISYAVFCLKKKTTQVHNDKINNDLKQYNYIHSQQTL